MRLRRHTTGGAERRNRLDPAYRGSERRRFRRIARDISLVLLIVIAGFFASAVWLSPVSVFGRTRASVPSVIGTPLTDARELLTQLGYRVTTQDARAHPSAPRGTVFFQDPPQGTTAPEGTTVTLTVSTGPADVPVPDVAGLDVRHAQRVLEAAGLRMGEVDSIIDRTELGGIVLGSRPSAGMGRRLGSRVSLIVNGAAR